MGRLPSVNRSAVFAEAVLADPSSNPYSVSALPEDTSGHPASVVPPVGDKRSFDPDLISSTGMVIDTIRTTTFAGASFGLLVIGGVFVIRMFLTQSMARSGDFPSSEILTVVFLSCLVGGFLAFCCSVMVSLGLVGMTGSARGSSRRWDPPTMRLVHTGTGFLSGWLSAVILGLMGQSVVASVVVGLIPAIYGGLFTTFAGERKIRRAKQRQKILLGDALQEIPVSPLVSPLVSSGSSPHRTLSSDPPGRT